MSEPLPADEKASVRPSENATRVAEIIVGHVWEQYNFPDVAYLTKETVIQIASLAVQGAFNGLSGEWQ